MSTVVRLFPEETWEVVVLSNYDRAANHVFAHIEEVLQALRETR